MGLSNTQIIPVIFDTDMDVDCDDADEIKISFLIKKKIRILIYIGSENS